MTRRPHLFRLRLLRRQRDLAAGLHHHPAPRADRPRRADRDPLLRRLPLRPALRPQRVARVMPTVYPCVPGHEIVGRVTKVGSAVHQVQGGRPRRRRLPGRLRPHLPDCQAGLEQFCPNMRAHLQLARQARRPRRSPTAGTPTASSSTSASSCASRRTSTSPAPRRCCAPASRPTRRCATGA